MTKRGGSKSRGGEAEGVKRRRSEGDERMDRGRKLKVR